MMRNTFYSSKPSEIFSIGNNEFMMENLEVSSLMDTKILNRNMHNNGLYFQPPRSFTDDNNWLRVRDHLDFPDHNILDLQPGYEYMASSTNIPLLPIKKLPIPPPPDAISKTRKHPLEADDRSICNEGFGESPESGDWKRSKRRKTVQQCSSQCHQELKDCSAGIPQCRVQLPVRRSQKIGDKITALQKLVSPYGKTDTASVLQEASLYIKLLQEQIKNLFQMMSNSYSNISVTHQVNSKRKTISAQACVEGDGGDLGSRGLCLVPISSFREAAGENHVDAWAIY